MTSRKKNVINGAFASASTSIILQIASLLVIPLYLDLTSIELYGLWLTLGAILGWIKIGDMGLGLSLTRCSIEALESNNYNSLRGYIVGTVGITLTFGAIIFVVGYYFTDTLIYLFDIDEGLKDNFKKTYYILLIVAWIRPSCSIFSSIINAKQHIAFLHIKNTIVSLIIIIITLILLFYDFGITAFAYGLLVEALLTIIIDTFYIKSIDKKISLFPFKSSKNNILKLLDFGMPYQILKIANLVSTSTDNIIIMVMLGAASVSTYVFTGKLAFMLAVFLISIAPSVLFPGVSQLFELGEKKKINVLYLKLTDFSIRLGIFSGILFFFINETFINIWVGDNNYGGEYLTIVFVFWIFFESFCRGITAVIYASSDLSGLTIVSFLEALLNIIITLILINLIGLLGVAIGTVMSRTISVFYIPFKINKMLNINNFDFIWRIILNVLPNIIVMMIVGWSLKYLISVGLHPIIQIMIMVSGLCITNLILFEGMFLLKLKGIKFSERLNILKKSYSTI